MPDPLLTLSASAQRRLLLAREISAVELLDAALARIAALNPRLDAVVALDPEAARRQAAASDARLAAGTALPLDGLPVTIKDAFDVAGLVSTAGAPAHRDRVPEADAAAVARLRAAGAVILGKSNVPPWSGDFQTANAVYGTTRNPYDPERSPGGSSGGAAAAVATGMSAVELGSDLGGSIRWPAHACGLFGLKPSWGLVSTRGHVPPEPGSTREGDLVVAGPLARSAADLGLVLDVVLGPAAPDGLRPRLDPPRRTAPEGLRVAVMAAAGFAPAASAVSGAVTEAADLLRRAGARVDAARPAIDLAENFRLFALLNHALVAAGLPPAIRDRIAARARDFSPDDDSHPALQARGARLDAATYGALQARRAAIHAAWTAFFADHDVLLCPPAPVPAIPHDHGPDLHARRLSVDGEAHPYFDLLKWPSLATLSGLPAAVAPVTRDPAGLPVGVQIIAGPGQDRTAIAVAGMLEALGCRYVPPPILTT
ncbi:amidase [uncultured Methylobacterium sp.]|jgi:amidase|uniref:amidase n=1 Tax=uncultured Methylobacterium sp. TaxID=157278 RepID=UPI0026047ADD|nr:amidase [uncultured Methylobacterium sp.]